MELLITGITVTGNELSVMGTIAKRTFNWPGTFDAGALKLHDQLADLLQRLQPEAPQRHAFHAACFRAFRGEPVGGDLPLMLGRPNSNETALHDVDFNQLLLSAHELLTPQKALAKELWVWVRGLQTQAQAIALLTLHVSTAWKDRRPRGGSGDDDLRNALGTLLAHPASMSWETLELEGPIQGRWSATFLWASLTNYLREAPIISVVDYDRSLGDQPWMVDSKAWFCVLLFATLSAWGKLEPQPPMASALGQGSENDLPSTGSLYDQVISYFEAEDWEMSDIGDPEAFAVGFAGSSGQWQCFCKVQTQHQRVLFYSVAPVAAPADRRAAVAEFLTHTNYGMVIGNFELDYRDGEVRFKSTIDVDGATFSHALLRNIVHANVRTMDHYLPELMGVIDVIEARG